MIRALRHAQPDVVALQECAWRFRHQSMQIAGPLGMRASGAGTLGLVSRVPVRTEVRRLPAKARGGSRRALIADVGGVRLATIHWPLDRPVRESHAHTVVTWALETDMPFVLCGDFNERPGGSPIAILRDAGFVDVWPGEGGETWPSNAPRFRLDFILVRGEVEIGRVELLRPYPPASDHHGLIAELRVVEPRSV